jgi:hypothetical protein
MTRWRCHRNIPRQAAYSYRLQSHALLRYATRRSILLCTQHSPPSMATAIFVLPVHWWWVDRQADTEMKHGRAAMIRLVSGAMMGRRPLGKHPAFTTMDRIETIRYGHDWAWAGRAWQKERPAGWPLCVVVLVPCMHVPCLCLSAALVARQPNPFIPSVRAHSIRNCTPSIHACMHTVYLLPAAGGDRVNSTSTDHYGSIGACSFRFFLPFPFWFPTAVANYMHVPRAYRQWLRTCLHPKSFSNFNTIVILFFIWQTLSNHKVTRFKRFVSRFIGKLCN